MSETNEILKDIRTYLRISAANASRSIAKTTIDTLEKAQVYEKLSEGKSQRKIEEETKIAQTTISSWVGKFIEAGLVNPQGKPLFTLREIGINTADLAPKKRKNEGERREEICKSGIVSGELI
ncbi:MAG: hypothetical protein NWE95_01730 [Candidatus Bathyarchaeota archaeon]|nr:hypothetical protein [Candidatus Bathyarchaeota archaeon]